MSLFDYDLSDPVLFCCMVVFMFAVIVLRYFAIAGAFFLLFYIFRSSRWQYRKINEKRHNRSQYRKEIKWSMITAMIFAVSGAVTTVAWQKGYLPFYENADKYGWTYLILSVPLLMLLHETYYYWLHRLMHHPAIFRHVHKVHHDSYIPSPWTAFSFHPVEGLLEALILPVMLFFIPVHYYALLAYLTIMTFSSVINHLDVEIYPSGFESHWLGKWLIGATHHSLHHSQFRCNYGLYFTFWDKITGSESAEFKKLFRKKTGSKKTGNFLTIGQLPD